MSTKEMARFLVGVDGGGTGTRAVIAAASAPDRILGTGTAGPSGLALGVPQAWRSVASAVEAAFHAANLPLDWRQCDVACGLAGVNHAPWRARFIAEAPSVRRLQVETDAFTMAYGAHGGGPGVVIIVGTGSVGIALDADGDIRLCGGFGFPSSDEGSGAWIGLRAVRFAQQAADGRAPRDALAQAILDAMGIPALLPVAALREAVQAWVVVADQTGYGTLCRAAMTHATDPRVHAILTEGAGHVGAMIYALDPAEALPLSLCGSLGPVIESYLAPHHGTRLRAAQATAEIGALRLAARGSAATGMGDDR